MLVVLDTTVLIDFLRGRPAVQRVEQLWDSEDSPVTTAINIEEVVRGLRSKESSALDALLKGLQILGVTEREARTAGRWRREFSARGVTLAQADCLIAAATLEAGATLATANPKDFPMAGLAVDHWPVGK